MINKIHDEMIQSLINQQCMIYGKKEQERMVYVFSRFLDLFDIKENVEHNENHSEEEYIYYWKRKSPPTTKDSEDE